MVKRGTARLSLLLTCTILVASCDKLGTVDTPKFDEIGSRDGLTRDDFRDIRNIESVKKPAEVTANLGNVVEPPIPDLAEILAAPPKPKIGETQLVSLSVTDDVPLKDVLLEVARLAKVDIDVDASIKGGVSLRATDKPFNEVIDRIAEMAGLRYNMKNGVLHIERDTPYIQIYNVDLLNVDRSSQSNITSNTSSGGGSSGGSGGGGGGAAAGSSGGSTSSITYKADADFWSKFEASVAQILAYTPSAQSSSSATAAQPAPSGAAAQSASPAAVPPAPSSPSVPADQAFGGGGSGGGASLSPMAEASAFPDGSSSPSAAATDAPSSPSSSSAAASVVTGNKSFYILNRQAGTMTVSATQKQHETVRKFLDKISENYSAQVLIEAKIVEVDLNENYKSGINWAKFGSPIQFDADFSSKVSSTSSTTTIPTVSLLKDGFGIGGVGLDQSVKLLNEFGTTRALSSPRLHAMNNQQAILSFAENIVYFTVRISTTDAVRDASNNITTPAKVDVTSEQRTTPIGILLNMQPSINKETDEVTLVIRPTLTRKTSDITDPGFEVAKAGAIATLADANASADVIAALSKITSPIPQIETRELDSIVKIKSGQTLVIGGLLEDKIINSEAGVPYAAEIPFFGNLFKSVEKSNQKKELVIFIRASIIGTNGSSDPYDKGVYQKFIQDPRPLKF